MGVFIMFIGIGSLLLIAIAWWFLWSKLCDIEQKLFRMHDEVGLSLKQIESDLDNIEKRLNNLEDKL